MANERMTPEYFHAVMTQVRLKCEALLQGESIPHFLNRYYIWLAEQKEKEKENEKT